MKKQTFRSVLALLLVLCMTLSLFPTVLASELAAEPTPYAFEPDDGIPVHNQAELVAEINKAPIDGTFTTVLIANDFEITSMVEIPAGLHLLIRSESNDAMCTLTGSKALPDGKAAGNVTMFDIKNTDPDKPTLH